MNFQTGEIITEKTYKKLIAKRTPLNEIAQLRFFDMREDVGAARAEIFESVSKEEMPETWYKIVWYGNGCGGKVVRFKAGNPYGEKIGVRSSTKSDEEREEERLKNSLSRTRRRIFEIAACNPWAWFFTGTLDGEKCDRNDLNGTFKRLSQFLRDYRKKQTGERITYLIVPEQHKDGAWHFHGLINGISEAELHKFRLSDKIPVRIKRTIQNGTDVYSWDEYAKRFGYTTFTRTRSHEAVSKYVTKYITKEMQTANIGSGRHMFYASQKLNKPQILCEGFAATARALSVDYENDFIGVKAISSLDEAAAIAEAFLSQEIDIANLSD